MLQEIIEGAGMKEFRKRMDEIKEIQANCTPWDSHCGPSNKPCSPFERCAPDNSCSPASWCPPKI